MKFFLYIIIIYCFSLVNTFAQNTVVTHGNIDIIQESLVDTLVQKQITFYQNLKGYQGFRIQIFFDSGNNSKNKALLVKSEFTAKYPETEAYLIFQEPNYKVRVGDYRSRIDAQRFLHNIIEKIPNAFIVVDEIQTPKINQNFGEEDN